MSLKVLFNRESPVVRSLEIVGVALAAIHLWRNLVPFDWQDALFLLLLACSLFVFACDLIDWYPNEERSMGGIGGRAGSPHDLSGRSGFAGRVRIGIEVHFLKARVPTSYILVVASIVALLQIPYVTPIILILVDLMMLVVAPVNGILIWFHRFDKDPTPMNYFSLNKYLSV